MGGKGLSDSVQQGMLSNQSALVQIAQQQAANSEQLYGVTEPGLATAENFYQDLATGDPSAIMRAISPAAQQVSSAATGAKQQILQNAPAGGEKNLALEMVDVNKGAKIGDIASSSFLNAPNALAQLAGQGVGESISAAGTGISGYGTANQGLGQLGQLQVEQKGAQLGALSSIVGTAGTLAGGFI